MDHVLVVSISGVRGIIGRGLDPSVLVTYAAAFGTWARERAEADGREALIVVGRDGRVTGELCKRIVVSTLQSVGCDVVDAGMATTPTVQMAVEMTGAAGGVQLSASHNPAEWNALKLFNEKGEYLAPEEAEDVIRRAQNDRPGYVEYDAVGTYRREDFLGAHLDAILDLDFIDPTSIAAADFKVVVDGINSVGAVAVPLLLQRLGLRDEQIIAVNSEPHGHFQHTPEPLPENLTGTIDAVKGAGADVGFVVDPDVDRLALIADGGTYLSEELTQVLAADFLWKRREGPFVTNLSSSRAIEDVARKHGAPVHRSAVGEINVVKKMQEVGAVLGGEGNGGVILPELHYGRDALVGVAMILQHLAETKMPLSEMKTGLPSYALSKNKLPVGGLQPEMLLEALADVYEGREDVRMSTVDGVKLDLPEGGVHVRKSNTEPIVRIYAEARTPEEADTLAHRFMDELRTLGATG